MTIGKLLMAAAAGGVFAAAAACVVPAPNQNVIVDPFAAHPECNGSPNFCLMIRSQYPSEVFINGKSIGYLDKGQERVLSASAGSLVLVNFCTGHEAKRPCTQPDQIPMTGNKLYVVGASATAAR